MRRRRSVLTLGFVDIIGLKTVSSKGGSSEGGEQVASTDFAAGAPPKSLSEAVKEQIPPGIAMFFRLWVYVGIGWVTCHNKDSCWRLGFSDI
jgi:hypothetical protein